MSPAAKYAAAELARLARDPRDFLAPVALPKPPRPEPRGTWAVVRKFDDGKVEPIRMNMLEAAAAELAGELRDRMSDEDCAKGFQILAQAGSSGFRFTDRGNTTRMSKPFVSRSGTDTTRGAAERSAKARKAGRARWANR